MQRDFVEMPEGSHPPQRMATSGPGGGRQPTPTSPGLWQRLRLAVGQSAWLAICLKAGATLAGMLVLACIGAAGGHYGGAAVVPLTSELGPQDSWLAAEPLSPKPVSPDGGPARSGGTSALSTGSPSEPPSLGLTGDGRVVLNAATAEELRRLPGVGASRAQAIVKLRQRLGKFRRPRDLLRVRGIGPRSLRRMRPHLVLNPQPTDGGSD